MNTILISIALVLSFLNIIFFLKIIKLKKKNNSLNYSISNFNKKIEELNKPLNKKGYYIKNLVQNDTMKFKAMVYVEELDRYTNGTSKIKISDIEFFDISSGEIDLRSAERFVKKGFNSVKKTSDIEWLDSIDSIKKIRKSKIEEIKKSISN